MPEAEGFERQVENARVELERLIQRLSRLSAGSWRACRAPVVTLIEGLVALAERELGRSLAVPEVDDHVLADVVAVIGRDVLDAVHSSHAEVDLETVRSAIAQALSATR